MVDKAFVVKNGINVANGLIYANNGQVSIGNSTPITGITFGVAANDAIQLPIGNTFQRPAAANGLIRYNTDVSSLEVCGGTGGTTWLYTLPTSGNTQVQIGTIRGPSNGTSGFTFNKVSNNVSSRKQSIVGNFFVGWKWGRKCCGQYISNDYKQFNSHNNC